MTATVIDGRKVADGLTSRIATAVAGGRAGGTIPGLARVLGGDD